MSRKLRRDLIDENSPGVYHLTSRCVRRAFLCGYDIVSGRSFDHRRGWIEQRLKFLAKIFLIDMLGHGLMANHMHNIVRNRPDITRQLSKYEVAMRWWRLTRGPDKTGPPTRRDRNKIRKMLEDSNQIAEYRRRLSSISWLMSYLKQPIARMANREDDVTGHFWDGRFASLRIDTPAQLTAAMVYVDLNPIAAGVSETPEESVYTSVYCRIASLKKRKQLSKKFKGQELRERCEFHHDRDTVHKFCDQWLSPIDEQDEEQLPPLPGLEVPVGETTEQAITRIMEWELAPRASNKGCLTMSLERYLELVDWTGRRQREGKRGRIPQELAPILKRLGLETTGDWLATMAEWTNTVMRGYTRPSNTEPEMNVCMSDGPNIRRRQMLI